MMQPGRLLVAMLIAFFFSSMLVACAGNQVRGDDLYPEETNFRISEEAEIRDTTEVREVLDVLYQYRRALVDKDFGTLNRLVSEHYYDNAGNPDSTEDHYSYEDLEELFAMMAEHADQIRYEVEVMDVSVSENQAHIDYEFEYAYQYDVGDKATWDAGMDVNRLELIREGDRWRIVSGM